MAGFAEWFVDRSEKAAAGQRKEGTVDGLAEVTAAGLKQATVDGSEQVAVDGLEQMALAEKMTAADLEGDTAEDTFDQKEAADLKDATASADEQIPAGAEWTARAALDLDYST